MKKDFIMPIIVLPLICLVVSGALTVVNHFTEPVIISAANERAEAARRDIIPQADGFELIESDDFPRTIAAAYRTTNDAGFIFMINTAGYGGEISLICGISPDGIIIKTATLAQMETKGLATPVFEKAHEDQYTGKDKELIGITAVTGATISSTAYKNAVRDAFAAYETVRTQR